MSAYEFWGGLAVATALGVIGAFFCRPTLWKLPDPKYTGGIIGVLLAVVILRPFWAISRRWSARLGNETLGESRQRTANSAEPTTPVEGSARESVLHLGKREAPQKLLPGPDVDP